MKPEFEAGSPEACLSCGQGHLIPDRQDESFEHIADGETVLVHVRDIPIKRCTNCGEIFSGPEAARIEHESICRLRITKYHQSKGIIASNADSWPSSQAPNDEKESLTAYFPTI